MERLFTLSLRYRFFTLVATMLRDRHRPVVLFPPHH